MTRLSSIVPSEEDEQIVFVQWCRLNHMLVHHSPNETWGSTPSMKARAIKMKRLGTSKGFPDLLVFIPVNGFDGHTDAYQAVAIEMKRKKGARTSDEQKEWLKVLELAGIPCAVCKGADKAIEFVKEVQEGIKNGE